MFLFYCDDFCVFFHKFAPNINKQLLMTKDINRIKVVLVEQKKTGKWLAEQIGKDPATVSKWCTNTSQPDLRTLLEIAQCLEVDVKDLIKSSKQNS